MVAADVLSGNVYWRREAERRAIYHAIGRNGYARYVFADESAIEVRGDSVKALPPPCADCGEYLASDATEEACPACMERRAERLEPSE